MGLGPKVRSQRDLKKGQCPPIAKFRKKIAICPESLGNFEESAKRNQNALGGGRTCKDINN